MSIGIQDGGASGGAPASRLVVERPSGWSDLSPHPVRRWVARQFDATISLGVVVATILVPVAVGFGEGANTAIGLVLILYMVGPGRGLLAAFLNAAFLRWTSTTPGKWLCGVRIVRRDGAPLTYGDALRRELRAFLLGCGLYLPLIAQGAMIYNFLRLSDKGATSWDEARELLAEQRPNGALQTVLTLFAAVLLLAVLVLVWAFTIGMKNAMQAGA